MLQLDSLPIFKFLWIGVPTVFNGSLTFTSLANNTFDLVIPITLFTYNPSLGNLLLDVFATASSGSTNLN